MLASVDGIQMPDNYLLEFVQVCLAFVLPEIRDVLRQPKGLNWLPVLNET
jgi:hypothetical protein